MKFYETHFDEYINTSEKCSLHPKIDKIIKKFPKNINNFRNVIFYGPNGVGKYCLMLKTIKQYSPSNLKYEKKISILFNKEPFFLKISDIHFEIDMSLLGCNSKLLWHEIYMQIIDIISIKADKCGIIVCQNFHEIHSELLDIFYSYMQNINSLFIDLKFIILTKELSFIPDNILNSCQMIQVERPRRLLYNKCITECGGQNKLDKNYNLNNIKNIKNLFCNNENLREDINHIMNPHKILCDKIIDSLNNIDNIKFLKFRDLLYDIFIYNLDINECIWYIITYFIQEKKIKSNNLTKLLIKTYIFFQYYNNNYRPIYHVENYMFYLASLIHYQDSTEVSNIKL
jgi:hypothetical protein